MKILLISANLAQSPYPIYPLGVGMVAAALRRADHEVHVFDFLQHEGSIDALLAETRRVQPALVGISVRNIDNVNLLHEQRYIDGVRQMVEALRTATDGRIVLGGSGFSLMPEDILDATDADFGIVGEGERLFVEFAGAAARGEYPSTRCLYAEPELTGTAIPAAHYDPAVLQFYLQSGNVAGIQTKRGCPHHCLYCSYPQLEGTALRPRDPAEVVEDMRRLSVEHGARYIFFTDSVFNDNQGEYLALLDEMERAGVNVPWTAFFKPGPMSDETIARMKACGLQAVELGSDAASDETLRGLAKDFTFEEVLLSTHRFAAQGLPVAHYFMFGGPRETPATVKEGIANLRRIEKAVSFVFMGIRILPDTGLHRLAIQEGLVQEGQSLLDPVYYLSPHVERAWLEETLTQAFEPHRNIVFPPDALDSTLQFLHKLGFSGSMWDLMVNGGQRKRRAKAARNAAPSEPSGTGDAQNETRDQTTG